MKANSSKPPIIFLAFANDLVDENAYLRGLKKEREGILGALEIAQEAGLCEVISEPSTSVKNILNTFQKYGDRIAVFHYGGHANSFQLLLETDDGTNASAHSGGLVSFLSKQHGLKLIFLNGCSSQAQASDLIRAGLPSVIGTSNSINDDIATKLAVRFYQGLGKGIALGRAWNEAVDEVKIEKGTANMRLSWEGDGEHEATEAGTQFPWNIYYQNTADTVATWNLPDASSNPLFGLPPIVVSSHLPSNPFPVIEHYEREYAEVFFGRSVAIRDLYRQLVSQNAPPIILLHGKTSVGKSSLLEAGLFPRLDGQYHIIHVRGSGSDGFLNSVEGLFSELYKEMMQGHEGSEKEDENSLQKADELAEKLTELAARYPNFSNDFLAIATRAQRLQQVRLGKNKLEGVLGAWNQLEFLLYKPILLVIDQAEDLYIHPESCEEDSQELLSMLTSVFGDRELSPKGRVIMAIREEFVKQIDDEMRKVQLPAMKFGLARMNRSEIIDAVTGLTTTERFQTNYQLAIEENLPVIIADDLLEDKESAIAPVLQVILSKLWDKAMQGTNTPFFSVELYKTITSGGLLMDEFYEYQLRQLSLITNEYDEAIEYGAILEMLQLYTINQRNAIEQPLSSIYTYYMGDIEDFLRPAEMSGVESLKESLEMLTYVGLLISTGKDVKRLANDMLALLICRRVRESQLPVQRVNRLLAYKTAEHETNPSMLLNAAEVEMVVMIESRMRVLSEAEIILIEKSEQALEEAESQAWEIERSKMRVSYLEKIYGLSQICQMMVAYPEYSNTIVHHIPQEILEDETLATSKTLFIGVRQGATPALINPKHIDYEKFLSILNTKGYAEELKSALYEEPMGLGLIAAPDDLERFMEFNTRLNSYWLLVINPTQIRIQEANKGEVQAILSFSSPINTVDYVFECYPLVCTNDGLVSIWTFYGEKLVEFGDIDPKSNHHYKRAVMDNQTLILQSSTAIYTYELGMEAIKQVNQSHPLPLYIQKRLQSSLTLLEKAEVKEGTGNIRASL